MATRDAVTACLDAQQHDSQGSALNMLNVELSSSSSSLAIKLDLSEIVP